MIELFSKTVSWLVCLMLSGGLEAFLKTLVHAVWLCKLVNTVQLRETVASDEAFLRSEEVRMRREGVPEDKITLVLEDCRADFAKNRVEIFGASEC